MKGLAAIAVAMMVLACDTGTGFRESVAFGFEFDSETLGWTADFTDYPVGDDENMEFDSGHSTLPAPLDTTRHGFMIASTNRSDDVFMYIRRYVTGLYPDGRYRVRMSTTFATDAPAGCPGAGGAPGESVVIKAGASSTQPLPVEHDGHWRLNLDKGDQLEEGPAVLILGNVATSNTDCLDPVFELKTLSSGSRSLQARADEEGGIWLFIGSESGYESRSALYFTEVEFTLERIF